MEFLWRLSGIAKRFRIGIGGPELDATDPLTVAVRDTAGTGFSRVSAADPVADDDLVTLRHLKSLTPVFVQSIPSATWLFTHNLGYKPIVEVIVNDSVVLADVDYPTLNSVRVQFSSPQIGEVRIR